MRSAGTVPQSSRANWRWTAMAHSSGLAVLEHGGDAVAPVAEDAPAVLPDQTLQDGVMARDGAAHGILVFFPQPG